MKKQRTLEELFAETGETKEPEALPAGAGAKPANAEDVYTDLLRSLVEKANRQGTMSELVGALTWTLASIAGHYGKPYIAGDIVRRFGNFLCRIEEQKAAKAEAAQLRAGGRAFN